MTPLLICSDADGYPGIHASALACERSSLEQACPRSPERHRLTYPASEFSLSTGIQVEDTLLLLVVKRRGIFKANKRVWAHANQRTLMERKRGGSPSSGSNRKTESNSFWRDAQFANRLLGGGRSSFADLGFSSIFFSKVSRSLA